MNAPGLSIAIIRQRYNPFGGAERFVERAVDALARDGTRVTVIARAWKTAARDPRSTTDPEGPRILTCDPPYVGRWWRDSSFARAACAAARRERFDLVQSHERLDCCDVFRAGDGVHRQWLALRTRLQRPVARALTAANPYHRYVLDAERRMFEGSRLRAVICNSEMVRSDVLRHYRINPAKLHVIYNGVDLERFSPVSVASARESRRRELGFAPDEPVFLHVGGGFERKGVDRLLRAFARAAIPGARLVIVGRDKSLPRMKALATSLGIAGRTHFAGGQHVVEPWYGLADVFVLPTLYDPFPNAALEALACGLPIVTSRQCGAAELVSEAENGFVCDALDEPALTDRLSRAATELRTPAAAQAARASVEHLSLAAMSARLVALYRSLLAGTGSPGGTRVADFPLNPH